MDNKAPSELQEMDLWQATTLGLMIENVQKRHRYVAWGQCPQCLDCFTIEFDSLSILTGPDMAAAFSKNSGARIVRRRAGWIVFNGNYHLRFGDARVRVLNGSEGWNIFHSTCDKPLRILSVQERASISETTPTLDRANEKGDTSPGEVHYRRQAEF